MGARRFRRTQRRSGRTNDGDSRRSKTDRRCAPCRSRREEGRQRRNISSDPRLSKQKKIYISRLNGCFISCKDV